MKGIELIAEERRQQQDKHGFTQRTRPWVYTWTTCEGCKILFGTSWEAPQNTRTRNTNGHLPGFESMQIQ